MFGAQELYMCGSVGDDKANNDYLESKGGNNLISSWLLTSRHRHMSLSE